MSSLEESGERVVPVDTLVVGTGPSAICMSMALSGWLPHLRPERSRHPNQRLQRALERVRGSFLGADWERLSADLQGRSLNPVALLFDTLLHPDPDNLTRPQPSQLVLDRTGRAIRHRVVGCDPWGGVWNRLPPGLVCLSPGRWMELPPTTLGETDLGLHRPLRAQVLEAYQAYCQSHQLSDHLVEGRVLQIQPSPRGGFRALVLRPESAEPDLLRTRRVVLATGNYDLPLRLGISGEELDLVWHRPPRAWPDSVRTILVVGGGLSAADACRDYLSQGRRVLHAFLDARSLESYAYDREYYPDYFHHYRMMTGRAQHPGYRPLAGCRLLSVNAGGGCRLLHPDGRISRSRVDRVVVLIGTRPDFSFLPGELQRQLSPQPHLMVNGLTCETAVPGLYALGPLAGDNFVRFLVGGAWGVLRHLYGQGDLLTDSFETSPA